MSEIEQGAFDGDRFIEAAMQVVEEDMRAQGTPLVIDVGGEVVTATPNMPEYWGRTDMTPDEMVQAQQSAYQDWLANGGPERQKSTQAFYDRVVQETFDRLSTL